MSENHIVICRFCQRKNNVPVQAVFGDLQPVKCGHCHEPLFPQNSARLNKLISAVYEHHLDTKALENLQRIPGIDPILKTVIKESYERANRLFHQANTVAVTSKQFPRLHQLLLDAAFRLDIEAIPDMYVIQSPVVSAYTTGVDRPFIVLTSALLDLLEETEVLYVIGHELGHWQANHVLYKMASRLFMGAASALADVTLGLGRLLTTPVQLALLKWDRCSELTADRAGLLVVRRVDVAIQTLMKLAGGSYSIYEQMDYHEFIKQAEAFEMEQGEGINTVFVVLQVMYQSHPFPVWRTSEILKWAKYGAYLDILAGHYPDNFEATA